MLLAQCATASFARPLPHFYRDARLRRLGDDQPHPDASNCTIRFHRQNVDHFGFQSNATFMQRYFVHDAYWKPGGPIFFYAGNEADITLYVNHTGLMWESAERFNALLLFAEHTATGESRAPSASARPAATT